MRHPIFLSIAVLSACAMGAGQSMAQPGGQVREIIPIADDLYRAATATGTASFS